MHRKNDFQVVNENSLLFRIWIVKLDLVPGSPPLKHSIFTGIYQVIQYYVLLLNVSDKPAEILSLHLTREKERRVTLCLTAQF